MAHSHSLDVASCLEVQQRNDGLERDVEKHRRGLKRILKILNKTQVRLAECAMENKDLKEEVNSRRRRAERRRNAATESDPGRDHGVAGDESDSDSDRSYYEPLSTLVSECSSLYVLLGEETLARHQKGQELSQLKVVHQDTDVRLRKSEERCGELDIVNQELRHRLQQTEEQLELAADSRTKAQRASSGARQELAEMTRQRDQAIHDKEKMKAKLPDDKFFADVDRLKLELLRADMYNHAHEEVLMLVCTRFELPFPNVPAMVDKHSPL